MSQSHELPSAIPTAVERRKQWIWWRRVFNKPEAVDKERMRSWVDMRSLLASIDVGMISAHGMTRRSGIWYESIVPIDALERYFDTDFSVTGLVVSPYGLRPAGRTCPYGRLTTSRRIERFEFDLTEIDAIASSKSSDRYFASVDDFGADYVAYMQREVGEDGLNDMLGHLEIRVLGSTPTDSVGIRAWDGRLFLYNAGGSHHLAGAHHIANKIAKAVPICTTLSLVELNDKAIRWLVDSFHLFLVPKRPASALLRLTANIVGSAFLLKTPPIFSDEYEFLLMPRSGACVRLIADVFLQEGLPDVTSWFPA